jgi:hypothetical protein
MENSEDSKQTQGDSPQSPDTEFRGRLERRLQELEKETDDMFVQKCMFVTGMFVFPISLHLNFPPMSPVIFDGLLRVTQITAGWVRMSHLEEQDTKEVVVTPSVAPQVSPRRKRIKRLKRHLWADAVVLVSAVSALSLWKGYYRLVKGDSNPMLQSVNQSPWLPWHFGILTAGLCLVARKSARKSKKKKKK